MNSFREVYCARRHCTPQTFEKRLFWRTLPWHARLLAPWFLLVSENHFLPEAGLIASAAEATSMAAIRAQLRDFYWQSNGSGWWHRVARVRISAQRFEKVARLYLPDFDPNAEQVSPVNTASHAETAVASAVPSAMETVDSEVIESRRRELEDWEATLRRRELDLRERAAELQQRETRLERDRAAVRERERVLAESVARHEHDRRAIRGSLDRFADA